MKAIKRLLNRFGFSKNERRGVLWLLPLLIVVGVVLYAVNRPSFEESFLEVVDRVDAEQGGGGGVRRTVDGSWEGKDRDKEQEELRYDDIELFQFDPNDVTLQELYRLGFSTKTAAGIIKYRERGKRFEIAEDFATCYGVTIEHYTLLEPHIVIGDQYRVKRGEWYRDESGGGGGGKRSSREIKLTDKFDPNTLPLEGFVELGFSQRQAEVIVDYREMKGGFSSVEDFGECYVVSTRELARLTPYIEIEPSTVELVKAERGSLYEKPLELNGADSASLREVSGIGTVLVERIMEYRERLGGFVRVEQLAELREMRESNYERIIKQIWVDSCVITKIDVNFASHKNLVEGFGNHPYVSDKVLRRLLKQRQLKGGWSKLGDLVDENIMTQQEADRLAPYLLFIDKKE